METGTRDRLSRRKKSAMIRTEVHFEISGRKKGDEHDNDYHTNTTFPPFGFADEDGPCRDAGGGHRSVRPAGGAYAP